MSTILSCERRRPLATFRRPIIPRSCSERRRSCSRRTNQVDELSEYEPDVGYRWC